MQSLQVSCGYCCCCDACFTSVFCRGITLGCDSGSFGGRELLPLGLCTDTWISSSGVWWYIISVLQSFNHFLYKRIMWHLQRTVDCS